MSMELEACRGATGRGRGGRMDGAGRGLPRLAPSAAPPRRAFTAPKAGFR